MENHNNHTPTDSDMEKVLDQFSEEEQAGAKAIWRLSKNAQYSADSFSKNEIEEALENVHFRIEEDERSRGQIFNVSGFILKNARYLVAAVALLVLGFGFLFVPKTVTVPYAETALVQLPDGSTVEMNSGSTIQYNRLYAFTNRSITLNGEAYFSVENAEEPFIVEANSSAIEVTGTEFNVRSWANDPDSETTVTVTEGQVEFYPENQKMNRVSLVAGQTSRLNPEMSSPAQPSSASSEEALAWRERRLVFQEASLITILHDLERSFDVIIELDVDDMEYETLTAYYNRPANVETILEDICTVKGLRYTKTTNGFRIFK